MALIATSGLHSLEKLKMGSGQLNACHPLQFFFFPGMLEAVFATSDVMERPATLMEGRKEGRKEGSPQVDD